MSRPRFSTSSTAAAPRPRQARPIDGDVLAGGVRHDQVERHRDRRQPLDDGLPQVRVEDVDHDGDPRRRREGQVIARAPRFGDRTITPSDPAGKPASKSAGEPVVAPGLTDRMAWCARPDRAAMAREAPDRMRRRLRPIRARPRRSGGEAPGRRNRRPGPPQAGPAAPLDEREALIEQLPPAHDDRILTVVDHRSIGDGGLGHEPLAVQQSAEADLVAPDDVSLDRSTRTSRQNRRKAVPEGTRAGSPGSSSAGGGRTAWCR